MINSILVLKLRVPLTRLFKLGSFHGIGAVLLVCKYNMLFAAPAAMLEKEKKEFSSSSTIPS